MTSGGGTAGVLAIVAADTELAEGIERALAGAGTRYPIATRVGDLDELVLAEADPAIVVVSAGGQTEVVRSARAVFPHALIVAVVDAGERRDLRAALAEGADGVVVTERLAESLVQTIDAVRAGQVTVPRELRAALVKPTLSTREKQVLGMVVMGFTNGEIASKLVLTESTIKSHLSSAFAKLGVRSRSEAAALILDANAGLGTGILAISGGEGSNGG